jgi:hypothetical protein
MIKHVRYGHCLDETNKAVRCRKKVQGFVDGDSHRKNLVKESTGGELALASSLCRHDHAR